MTSFLEAMAASRPASFKEQAAAPLAAHRTTSKTGKGRSLVRALRAARDAGCGIIAEFKRASPSHGAFTSDAIVPRLQAYEAAGVHGISILTEPQRFNGSFEDLAAGVDATSSPILCKDFIVSASQLDLAARIGASAALIIAKLKPSLALVDKCLATGLEPLIEIHDRADLDAIEPVVRKDPGKFIVGINNRDLATLRVDTRTTINLAPVARRLLGTELVIIGESGIESPADASRLANAGVDGFLIGTAFMNTSIDMLGASIKEFINTRKGDG